MVTRRVVLLAAVALVAAAALDWSRAPEARWSTRAAVAGIHGYQATVGPLLGRSGVTCRFTPTCSRYSESVIGRFGIYRGGWLATRRILRCGPWTPMGTHDEPPAS